ELNINDSYSVADIKVSGDFTIENEPEDSIVTVVPPTDEPTEEEVEAMEGEAATEEPERVGEENDDEEEENKEEE
ncbi:50S ribosomal protein L25/general stress protein Ctc, partial [Vibrio vulnificus]